MVQLTRSDLRKRLGHGLQEYRSGRTLLTVARVVVGLNLLLVAFNLWRGWRRTDYYYLFILLVWAGLVVVQTKIQRRKRAELQRLQQELIQG